MRFPKVSEFFNFVMNKYGLKRKELAAIMGVAQSTIHNFLTGYTAPKKNALRKLARYLNEKPEVLEALAYEVDKKGYSAGVPEYPKVRSEILKNCYSKSISFDIVNTNGIHDYELFLSGYMYMLMEDVKRLETQDRIEVIKKDFCLNAIKTIEKDPERLKKMFEPTGKWFASGDGHFVFENAPLTCPPLKFFFEPDEALKEMSTSSHLQNKEEVELINNFRKLSENQKTNVLQLVKEKLFYDSFKE